MTMRVAQLIAAAVVVCTALIGCGAAATQQSRAEAVLVRQLALNPITVEMTPRVECIRKEIVARGADPSKLRVISKDAFNATTASVIVDAGAPQIDIEHEVRRTLKGAAFTVAVPMRNQPHDPNRWRHQFSVVVSSYSPLTQSLSGVDELDLLFLEIDRNMLVARGSVRVTAELQVWDGQDYVVWKSAQAQGTFYMVKDKKNLNAALTTGRARIARGKERVEVSSVQDATLLVTQHAVASVVASAFALDC